MANILASARTARPSSHGYTALGSTGLTTSRIGFGGYRISLGVDHHRNALEKALMNSETGFGRRLLSIFENHGISYEHTPSGIDTMSVVVADSELNDKLDDVIEDIRTEVKPDSLEVYPGMALIATVGRGMAYKTGMAAKVFTALAHAGVNIRMIDQGSSEINIIVGVEMSDFEKAMCAIYTAFMK